jgi:SAM-dependent methyltransferase
MSNFSNYSKYYDLLNKGKDYGAECDYIVEQVQKYKPNSIDFLELGCGSAEHAFHLSKKGYRITGIERSPGMIESAKSKGILNFEVSEGDATNFSLDKHFDCCLSLFHVISYITDTKDLISCFKHVSSHLKPGGLFMFDIWYAPAVLSVKPENRIRRFENDEVSIVRFAEPTLHTSKNVVDVNFELHIYDKIQKIKEVINEVHPMRYFSIPEIDMLVSYNGFEMLAVEEYLTGNEVSSDSWGVFFILKKKNEQ